MPHNIRVPGLAPAALTISFAALAVGPVHAWAQQSVPAPVKQIVGLFRTGGYFLTAGSGRAAFGSPKFYDDTSFYTRPKRIGAFVIAGGVESMEVSDHLLPFTGGNQFVLLGPSVAVTTPRKIGRVRPYLSGGLFLGELRSVNLGFDRTAFTPSVSIGAEYPISRYFTLNAGYRVSQYINGINTDGLSISLRIF